MTGPEHYTEAERLLASQYRPAASPGYGPLIAAETDAELIAVAQAHATLALAAATALRASGGEAADERLSTDDVLAEWWRAAS